VTTPHIVCCLFRSQRLLPTSAITHVAVDKSIGIVDHRDTHRNLGAGQPRNAKCGGTLRSRSHLFIRPRRLR
jgi:hypothetical protein